MIHMIKPHITNSPFPWEIRKISIQTIDYVLAINCWLNYQPSFVLTANNICGTIFMSLLIKVCTKQALLKPHLFTTLV